MRRLLRVLIVDEGKEDSSFVKSLLGFLPGFRMEFEQAFSIGEGMDLILAGGFDLIFMDIKMEPEIGIEMLQAVRGRGIKTPVIVLTGIGDEKLAVDLMKAGADDFLVKADLTVPILEKSIRFILRQRSLEMEKEHLRVELIHAQKMESLGTLAGGLAHDFNNLLMGINGYARIGLLKTRDASARKNLEAILNIGNKMAQLVEKILRFAQPVKSGNEFIDMALVIDDVISILKHTIPKNIRLVVHKSRKACMIVGNSAEIEQILLNLCVNAVEAMPDGGVLTIRAGHPAAEHPFFSKNTGLKPETCCLLEVADTGTGIPAKYRDRIFDPFFSTKDTPDRKGTGLGLSIVYNTILSYGGNITFRSEENKGTTFQILIPGPRGKFKIERVENGGKMPKGNENILIVDDEKHVRDVVKDSLEWLGYHVSLAGNGKDAIDFIRNSGKKIDLVLLDISMPEMDGEECLREFTTMAPDIPVVIFSGHTGDDIAIRMLKAGAVSFLSKPVDLNELAGTVRHSIDSARKQSTVKNMQSVT